MWPTEASDRGAGSGDRSVARSVAQSQEKVQATISAKIVPNHGAISVQFKNYERQQQQTFGDVKRVLQLFQVDYYSI
jgi:hypothetical protein